MGLGNHPQMARKSSTDKQDQCRPTPRREPPLPTQSLVRHQRPQTYRKLCHRYIDPFKILRQINKVTYRLDLRRHYHIAPFVHVSRLKPVIQGPVAIDTSPATPPATFGYSSALDSCDCLINNCSASVNVHLTFTKSGCLAPENAAFSFNYI